MASFLNSCGSSNSEVAVCISTCSSEASNVFSVVMVADKDSVTEWTVSVGFSIGNCQCKDFNDDDFSVCNKHKLY